MCSSRRFRRHAGRLYLLLPRQAHVIHAFPLQTWTYVTGYTVLDSFADWALSSIPHKQVVLGVPSNISSVSWMTWTALVFTCSAKRRQGSSTTLEAVISDHEQGIGGGGQVTTGCRFRAVRLNNLAVDEIPAKQEIKSVTCCSTSGFGCMD